MADEIWVVEWAHKEDEPYQRRWKPTNVSIEKTYADAMAVGSAEKTPTLVYRVRRFVAADSIDIEAEVVRKYMREHTEG